MYLANGQEINILFVSKVYGKWNQEKEMLQTSLLAVHVSQRQLNNLVQFGEFLAQREDC
jgi:hypothetical protein